MTTVSATITLFLETDLIDLVHLRQASISSAGGIIFFLIAFEWSFPPTE